MVAFKSFVPANNSTFSHAAEDDCFIQFVATVTNTSPPFPMPGNTYFVARAVVHADFYAPIPGPWGGMWLPYNIYTGQMIPFSPGAVKDVHVSAYFVDLIGGVTLPPVGVYRLRPVVEGGIVTPPANPLDDPDIPDDLQNPEVVACGQFIIFIYP
jgi:hypothetical protein